MILPDGVLVPLTTPFLGKMIDEDAFADHIERVLSAGVAGLVIGALAGEGPTLASAEHERLLRTAIHVAAGRVPVIATTGTPCTSASVRATLVAQQAGAQAAIIVTPYYNKPTQAGILAHVSAIAEAGRLPLILHNTPARTNLTVTVSTARQLAALPAVVALLDEEVDMLRWRSLAAAAPRLATIVPDLLAPAPAGIALPRTCLAALANVEPRLCVQFWESRRAGHHGSEAMLCRALAPLQEALQRGDEVAALKYAVSLRMPGFSHQPRLPLVEPDRDTMAAIRAALAEIASFHDAVH